VHEPEQPQETYETTGDPPGPSVLHPAWWAFIEYCAKLGHGEVEKLKVQDGLPVIAEAVPNISGKYSKCGAATPSGRSDRAPKESAVEDPRKPHLQTSNKET